MRKLSAHYIFTGTGRVLEKGIITLTDQGIVAEIIDTNGLLQEQSGLEFYSGVITPGFVNAHCHLELSHLKGLIPEKIGLPGFLNQILQLRTSDELKVVEHARNADAKLAANGVVAVGDVSNSNLTHSVKYNSKIVYHTFVEALGFSPKRAIKAFTEAANLLNELQSIGLAGSMTPHSPYSNSTELFALLSAKAIETRSILSMHSQESSEEDELFRFGSGAIYDHLIDNHHLDLNSFQPTGNSALESVIEFLPTGNHVLLVHNIHTTQKDLDTIKNIRSLKQTWFVVCPNSNIFIEDRLPDLELLRKNKVQICIGTDSLASNHKLSILEELITIQAHFPDLSFAEMMIWATRNGAEALSISDWAGTIEVGKKPGINLITGMDLPNLRLRGNSQVKKLI